jgi:TRAP-type mannitol/chloroaromatic compound transport system permease small subunit
MVRAEQENGGISKFPQHLIKAMRPIGFVLISVDGCRSLAKQLNSLDDGFETAKSLYFFVIERVRD